MKNHIDFADDLDLIVKHENRHSTLEKNFGNLLGAGIQLFGIAGGLFRKILFDILTDFHIQRGYYVVETPMVAASDLYEISGHLEFYKQNMYVFNIEDKEFVIKPMNCPHHILILSNILQKYRRIKFPFRIFELGRVHRYEPSGSLFGLLRVRAFTQDDAHIFCEPKDVEREMLKVFEEMRELYEKLFHIRFDPEKIKLRLSFYDPNDKKYYAGNEEEWEEVQEFMRNVAEKINKKYGIEYFEMPGEAVFYGPKLDFVAKFGESEWQIGTIQFDFNLPRRFKLNELVSKVYEEEKQIYMIHRALLGSIERFLGVYLEFKKGRLPFVLAPVQTVVIGIKTGKEVDEKIVEKVNEIYGILKGMKIRTARLISSKTELSSDIRKLETSVKPPVLIFIGEKEIEEGKISIKYYNLEKERYEKGEDLEKVINKLEDGVRELIGKVPRVFEDLEYMI